MILNENVEQNTFKFNIPPPVEEHIMWSSKGGDKEIISLHHRFKAHRAE